MKATEHANTGAVKRAIKHAFKVLATEGIRTERGFLCCNGCAASQIDADRRTSPGAHRGYAFYHKQDSGTLRRTGVGYISFGMFEGDSVTLGNRLVNLLCDAGEGVSVDWDGTAETRPRVYVPA